MGRPRLIASLIIGLIGAAVAFPFAAGVAGLEGAAGGPADYVWLITPSAGLISGFGACFGFSMLYLKLLRNRSPSSESYNRWWPGNTVHRWGEYFSLLAGFVSAFATLAAHGVGVAADQVAGGGVLVRDLQSFLLGLAGGLAACAGGALVFGAGPGYMIGKLITRVFEWRGWSADKLSRTSNVPGDGRAVLRAKTHLD